MTIEGLQIKYVFPRIPLKLSIPGEYPDIGNISSISVVPEIKNVRLGRNEVEFKGSYNISVSYFGPRGNRGSGLSPDGRRADESFGFLQVEGGGLPDGEEGEFLTADENAGELYTVDYSRPFHTYVDIQALNPTRNFRPAMAVERINLVSDGTREMKGELVLALVNRAGARKR